MRAAVSFRQQSERPIALKLAGTRPRCLVSDVSRKKSRAPYRSRHRKPTNFKPLSRCWRRR